MKSDYIRDKDHSWGTTSPQGGQSLSLGAKLRMGLWNCLKNRESLHWPIQNQWIIIFLTQNEILSHEIVCHYFIFLNAVPMQQALIINISALLLA
jgi:hypothetical protein